MHISTAKMLMTEFAVDFFSIDQCQNTQHHRAVTEEEPDNLQVTLSKQRNTASCIDIVVLADIYSAKIKRHVTRIQQESNY